MNSVVLTPHYLYTAGIRALGSVFAEIVLGTETERETDRQTDMHINASPQFFRFFMVFLVKTRPEVANSRVIG